MVFRSGITEKVFITAGHVIRDLKENINTYGDPSLMRSKDAITSKEDVHRLNKMPFHYLDLGEH